MTEPPQRYKERDELTPDESLAAVQAQRRGDPEPRFETPEYRAARNQALRGAGFEADADAPVDKPLDELTADEHYEQVRRGA